MHCIMFRISSFTVQLFVVAYHILLDINEPSKELKANALFRYNNFTEGTIGSAQSTLEGFPEKGSGEWEDSAALQVQE